MDFENSSDFANSSPVMAHAVTEAVLPQALQLEEIIQEQAKDPTCRDLTDLCGPDTRLDFNEAGLLVRKAPLDGSEQIVIPAALQPRLLYLEHYPEQPDTPVSRGCSDPFGEDISGKAWPRT